MKTTFVYMDFKTKLSAAWTKNDSLLCVGLDPDIDKLPEHLRQAETPYFDFNREVIDATADLVCAYKPNSAFYEARGAAGVEELKKTCAYIQEKYPHIPIILDFKRGDIGNTNNHYAAFAFDYLGADAITVLCRMSNEGAGEFQDLEVNGRKLYFQVAENVAKEWNVNGNCLLVVGATFPAELSEIRQLVGDEMIFLVPGVGAQGGDVEATVK